MSFLDSLDADRAERAKPAQPTEAPIYYVRDFTPLQIMPAPAGLRAVFWGESAHEVRPVHVIGVFRSVNKAYRKGVEQAGLREAPAQIITGVVFHEYAESIEASDNFVGYLEPDEDLAGSLAEQNADAIRAGKAGAK